MHVRIIYFSTECFASRGTAQPLPSSREFPDGRWVNNTMGLKDAWIEQYYNTIVNSRLEVEGDKDLQKQGWA